MTSNTKSIDTKEINGSPDSQMTDPCPESMNAESDDDSGIVAISNNKRIGSTASNSDEDHVCKDRPNQSSIRSLTYGSKLRVRFDDELPLSEQSMRKSCKKLFETLKHQNKDNLISTSLNEESVDNPSVLPSCHCHHFKQTFPSISAKCFAHSDHNLSVGKVESFDDNELLITTYGQKCNYRTGKPFKPKYSTLDNRQSHSFRSINDNQINKIEDNLNKKALDCDAALDRIKKMSDRLESSSMVNAFARPAFIKSADFGQTMDTLYETIFPTEKSESKVKYSSNSHINQWLNNSDHRVEAYEDRHKVVNSEDIDISVVPMVPTNRQTLELNSRKPFLKCIPNDIQIVNTLSPSKSSYISADQIYPDLCSDDRGNEDLNKFETSFEEQTDNRFSHSYSAGDDMKRGILRNRLKPAISEMDLNRRKGNSSPKSKTFLQRFKSVFSRAFTNDNKPIKQSQLSLNTMKNSKSLSQIDVRFNTNTKDNKTGRVDRSPSFVKNIRTRMSLRRNKVNSPDRLIRSESHKSLSNNTIKSTNLSLSPGSDGTDTQVWGELMKLNSDSSQVIQIHRQKGRAFGFFVARGTVNNVRGVFVSRMKDEETQKSLTGVLEIGDEILAIDGESVKEANIIRVNQLIANKDTIRLTINPFMNNKYL